MMMKKIIKYSYLLLCLCFSQHSYAQKLISGSYSVLSMERAVGIKWDFSSTLFEKKYDEKTWIATIGENEWNKAKDEAMAVILNNVNDELKKKSIIVVDEKSGIDYNFIIIITPIKLDRKGNNESDYVLKNVKNDTEVARIRIKGDGGHWGDLGNLLGDGYEEAAEKLGKHIKKSIK